MLQKATFKISKKESQKCIDVEVGGVFGEADAKAFIEEYNKCLQNIEASNYVLNLNCTELKVVRVDIVPLLEGCFAMYKKSGFNIVKAIVNDTIVRMQLSRLANKVGLNLKVSLVS